MFILYYNYYIVCIFNLLLFIYLIFIDYIFLNNWFEILFMIILLFMFPV